MMFFTADNHYDHANSIRLCNRPYESVEHMNEDMIEKWNNKLTNNDDIIIAGDMFFRSQDPEAILRRLKGKKHLIIGNHDKTWMSKTDLSVHFKSVEYMTVVNTGKGKATLCHFPMLEFEGKYLIHGHIHNKAKKLEYWDLIKKIGQSFQRRGGRQRL